MDDLISRSALISRFKQLQGSDTLANMFVSDVIKVVKNQPTAYNRDKVLEKINEERGQLGFEQMRIDKAIELVKAGGVSE